MTGTRPAAAMPRTVLVLATVSLLTDLSSEMIAPLLPLFLVGTLGAGAGVVGAIEGAAEAVAAAVKLLSGRWSDRAGRRTPVIIAGYTLATLARPLVALATSSAQVAAVRLTDRVGKGLRGPPRDALIADAVDASTRGRAFGLHRAADHTGALLGPLVASALLAGLGMELRSVFLLALAPGLLAVLVLVTMLRDAPTGPRATSLLSDASTAVAASPSAARSDTPDRAPLPPRFVGFLALLALATVGASTDAFFVLRAAELGAPTAVIPLLWGAMHAVKAATSMPAGALSDRIGRRPLLLAGWTAAGVTAVAFAVATARWQLWPAFLLAGVHHGLSEGSAKALVADLVPAAVRGRAFAWYHVVTGLGVLPAAVLVGSVWDRWGASPAFGVAAGASLGAVLLGAMLRVGVETR